MEGQYIRLIDIADLIIRGKDIVIVDIADNDVSRKVLFDTLAVCEEHTRAPAVYGAQLVQLIKISRAGFPTDTTKRLQITA